ncbi:MAG: ATP phosphoribosyltransferase [Caulobacteraceae bacterium]
MTGALVLALPSKGRLKEQADAWLADCGVVVRAGGGERGYAGAIDGFDGIEIRFLSAGDIASALVAGEIHLGVTGEDLLAELGEGGAAPVLLLVALDFGRANLVVAAPRSWIDVDTMADVDDVARLWLARTGRRLRVATKYPGQTRGFFAAHGIADYRVVDSGGATEGAPAAGSAEMIVDITTTGATLAANGLKILEDGVILRSRARLAAGLSAGWDTKKLDLCRRLLGIFEARARGRDVASLVWPAGQDAVAREALAPLAGAADQERANGMLVAQGDLFAAAAALAAAGVGPVSVTHPAYVFEAVSAAGGMLARALGGGQKG